MTELDKSMNRSIPLFFYVVYELEDGLHGYLVNWKPAWEESKGYEVVYHFNGKRAHYWIATQDRSITRKQALDFAVCMEMGKVRRQTVNLEGIGT